MIRVLVPSVRKHHLLVLSFDGDCDQLLLLVVVLVVLVVGNLRSCPPSLPIAPFKKERLIACFGVGDQ